MATFHNDPTAMKPSEKSPSWYIDFHNSFYLSQITTCIFHDCFKCLSKEIGLHKGDCNTVVDQGSGKEIISPKDTTYKTGALALVQQFVENSSKSNDLLNLLYTGMQLNPPKSIKSNDDVSIDIDVIKSMTKKESWFEILKGFINLWEFLFLFGISEKYLKQVLPNSSNNTKSLIGAAFKKFSDLTDKMKDYDYSRNYCYKLWGLLVCIRDIYAHAHGVSDEKNIEDLKNAAKEFNSELESIDFDKSFSGFDTLEKGNYILLNDSDMNIFREFIKDFMYQLQLLCINEAAGQKSDI